MEFAISDDKKSVKFTINKGKDNEFSEETTAKFALQFATLVIEKLTHGSQSEMVRIFRQQ